MRNEVQLHLNRLGLEAVILADRPNVGRTLIEKFVASGCLLRGGASLA